MEDSIWQTWKPYAAALAIVIGGFWWYDNQSSLAALDDGVYGCQRVFVNEDGKYQSYADDSHTATAEVSGGQVVRVEGKATADGLTVRNKGRKHFHVTDDPALHSYEAVACWLE